MTQEQIQEREEAAKKVSGETRQVLKITMEKTALSMEQTLATTKAQEQQFVKSHQRTKVHMEAVMTSSKLIERRTDETGEEGK